MQSKYSALVKLVNDQTHFLIDINDYRVLIYDHIIFDSFVVQQKSTSKKFMITSYFVQDCTNEFTRMMMCRYPSILGIKGFSPVDPDDSPKPSILTDYYKMTLYDYINTRKTGNYTKTNDYIIILGMTIGLRFLNNNGIIHELLHPGSILLDENFYPIIQNVEINKRLIYRFVDQINFMMKQSGYYMSPEQAEEYSFQTSNVFSYSFILYNLITLKHPFDRISKMSAYKALHMIVSGYRPTLHNIEDEAIIEFLERCWSQDPQRRFTFDEILDIITQEVFYAYFEPLDRQKIVEYLDKYGNEFDEIKKKFE